MDDSVVFASDARWRQCAPNVTHFLRPPKSTTQTASRSVQPFLHSSWQSVVGHVLSLKMIFCMGDLDSLSNTCFLRPTRVHNPNGIFIGSSAQLTADSAYTLQWVSFPQKLPIPMGDLDPSNTWFLRPIRVLSPNGILIGSAIFAGLTTVTNRPTDRPRYSVCNSIGRIYVRSITTRSNNELIHHASSKLPFSQMCSTVQQWC